MNHAPQSDAPAPARAEQRLGTIHADRPCIRCGFNLHGQPILREPVYQMVIARCPECGQVASLQEYPSLGRWAGRWAGVGAVLWLLVLLWMAIVSARLMYDRIEQTGMDVFTPGGLTIAREYREFLRVQLEQRYPDPAQRAQMTSWWDANSVEQYPMVGADYLADPAFAAVRSSLTLANSADWGRGRTVGWLVIVGVLLGAAWSVLCPHFRLRGLLLLALLLTAGVAAWWGWRYSNTGIAAFYGGQEWGPTLAFKHLGTPVVLAGLGGAWIALVAGMLVGRPIARWMVIVLLPPRLRTPLGFLWTMQGKDVPGTRRRPAPRAA